MHLPTANRHKLLTKDVDKRDGGAYYTPIWLKKNEAAVIRHVVGVTSTPTALKTLIALSDMCRFYKMPSVTNSVSEIHAG